MLKTIKVKKEVRIDELINYITMNAHTLLADKEFYTFKSKHGTDVTIDREGKVNFSFMLYIPEDLFTIEIEEEITKDTIFQELYSVYYSSEKSFRDIYNNASINDIILEDSKQGIETERIYVLYKGKIKLIWESED